MSLALSTAFSGRFFTVEPAGKHLSVLYMVSIAFRASLVSVVKNSPANAGDEGLIPGSGRSPGEGNRQPAPVFLPGESHRQRSLLGYSPWGRKDSDMT